MGHTKIQRLPKLPFVPKETEIDQLIAACRPPNRIFIHLLKETVPRPEEAWKIEWGDLDFETNTILITPEKNSNPRIFHISQKLISMLQSLTKNYGKHIFAKPNMSIDSSGITLAPKDYELPKKYRTRA